MADCLMQWHRQTEYNIRSGEFSICKVFVQGCTLYELWKGKERIGSFNDADEAKEAAEKMA